MDLLYKILLALYIDDVGHPYSQEYINNFMDELVPLFELSGIEADIDLPSTQKETMEELKNKLETELSRLKKVFESGNFLAKDEKTIKNKISDISSYLEDWDLAWDESGVVEGIFKTKEEILNKNKQIYERSLFADLKKKLGLGVGDVYFSWEEDYSGERKWINLVEKRDTLKKDLKDFIEKLQNLGNPNK